MEPVLVFRSGGEEFGLGISKVLEVRQPGEVLPLPGAPPFIVGISHVRGRPLPVVNLAQKLGREPSRVGPASRFLVVKSGEVFFSLLVDSSSEVLEEIADTQVSSPQVKAQVEGVVDLGGRLIMLLDLHGLLSAAEKNSLAGLVPKEG